MGRNRNFGKIFVRSLIEAYNAIVRYRMIKISSFIEIMRTDSGGGLVMMILNGSSRVY